MAKKPKNPKKPTQVWTKYEAKGELKRKNPNCPKCGPGVFLGVHSNRQTCGRCGYMEKKTAEAKA